MKKLLFLFLISAVLLTGCGQYSTGHRVGTITKFSQKGLVWKTWEGQINLGGTATGAKGNIIPNIWEFSIDAENPNDDFIGALQEAMEEGVRAKIQYNQEIIVAPWRADTQYLVTGVELLDQAPDDGAAQ